MQPAPRHVLAPAPAPPAPRAAAPRPFTVAEVLNQVRACLDDVFRPVLVVGEVVDLRRPRNGHVYLTLRDATARLRVVLFADQAAALKAPLADGDEVLVWGKMSAYAPTGDVQLIASRLEPRGAGAHQARREALQKRLAAEGLFDPARKRPLPFLPRAVGVVTSPTGAAIRDVLTTIERRFPAMSVVIAPVRVNGAGAAPEVARQLLALDRADRVDVILVVRGGGSQEDLAAFDAEGVVRAIAACRVPVITGVGHETDTTLADLVADRRAPTPTGAAELAIPVQRELVAELARREQRLRGAVTARLTAAKKRCELAARAHGLAAPRVLVRAHAARLDQAASRLAAADPRVRLARWRELLDAASARLERARLTRRDRLARALDVAAARLAHATPATRLPALERLLAEREARLTAAARQPLERARAQLAAGAGKLASLSPLEVLARGYSLTTAADDSVLRDASTLREGDLVHTRLAKGALESVVVRVHPDPS